MANIDRKSIEYIPGIFRTSIEYRSVINQTSIEQPSEIFRTNIGYLPNIYRVSIGYRISVDYISVVQYPVHIDASASITKRSHSACVMDHMEWVRYLGGDRKAKSGCSPRVTYKNKIVHANMYSKGLRKPHGYQRLCHG